MSPRQTIPACSNAERHQPHPTGYFACSAWADNALLVADQKRCPDCGRWEIWTPKRPDARIAVNWPPPNCDWGSCDGEGVAERYAAELNAWLPVCAEHLEVGS